MCAEIQLLTVREERSDWVCLQMKAGVFANRADDP